MLITFQMSVQSQKDPVKAGGSLILIVGIIIIALVFSYILTSYAPELPGAGGMYRPSEPVVTNESQALALAKASFAYFPEPVAETSVIERDPSSWIVTIRIPGRQEIYFHAGIYGNTWKFYGPVYQRPVNASDAEELAKFMAGDGSLNLSVSLINSTWVVRGDGINYEIERTTGGRVERR